METFQWLKPSPLWNPAAAGFAQPELFVPRLLKYESDDFVEEFIADAARPDPAALGGRVLPATSEPAKLFQPAHGVFHLVCASLCCRVPGFPNRQLRPEHQEKVSFVVRRIDDQGAEFGWLGAGKGWQPLGSDAERLLSLAADGGDEERLPLLPATAADGRSLWFGYLPTASADTYKTVAPPRDNAPAVPVDPRIEDDLARFVTPLKGGALNAITDTTVRRTVAVYLLLELAEFLGRHVKPVLDALPGSAGTTLPGTGHTDLLRWLQGEQIGTTTKQSLAQALRSVADRAALLNAEGGLPAGDTTFGDAFRLETWAPNFTVLTQRVQAALDPAAVPKIELPRLTPAGRETYVVRCVYERPLCELRPVTVSARSAEFRFAAFFDTEAPARPIRIALPTDVSPAAMRKFKKGVSFLISGSMQRKIASLTGKEKDLLKGDAPNPEAPDLAFMCSFSIQIIFIVAFFLLMLFVVILNLIFWWLPFFKICIPIPKGLLGGSK